MLASIAALIYVMDQYRLRAQYAAEREQDLQMAQELQQTTSAYLVYFNGTYIEVRLQSQFPYSYEVVGLSIRLANGSPLVVTGSGPSANVTVVGPYGIIYGLPASAGPAQQLMVIVKLTQGLVVSQANMAVILRSGDAVTAVPVTVYLPPGTSRGVSVNVNNETSVMELIKTKVITNLVLIVSPSMKIAIPKAYTVVNLTPIVLYNPTGDPTPTGLTVNFTINLSSGIVKRNAISAKDGTGVVPLANVLFAIWNGTGWDPLDGWIEFYNSTAAEVWVKLDRSIEPYGNQTIFMLFLNGSALGTINWGVNSYYTKNLSTDNIGYVMQSGVLYQVYVDENGTLFDSVYSWWRSGGQVLADYCSDKYKYQGTMVGFSYGGLAGFLYSLPLYDVTSNFSASYGYCVVYNGPLQEPMLYYSPQNPSIMYYNNSAEEVYNGFSAAPVLANGTFISYGEPSVAVPSDEPVYDWQNYLIEGYDVIFNYQNEFIGGQPWPYGLYEAQHEISWLVKGVGWAQVINPNVTIATTTDDGTLILLKNSTGGGSFTSWLGSSWRKYELLPVWATDYDDDWNSPVTFEAPLNSILTRIGDYRVEVLYYQDIGTDTYFAVFVPSSSMAPYLIWYAPVFPPGGSYPYAFAPLAPGLLLGPPAPVQGWIVG
ncbi:hypothetical protein [Acidilobus sp. 7A]|uniref:hypothetical protein n=1 Tax=Acidilobus sp. 7A TaxID=1577685 RepID=UPI000764CFE6|nr:hypothetical protein [Acidilobus sp. 7A]AMD30408.1 hypothetical protein SE86_02315 [Acidilobus sp. 7A]